MSLTFVEFNDEALDVFKAAWDTTGYQVFYEDLRDERESDEDPWCAIWFKHTTGRQATLNGAVGEKTFRRGGYITVQIFTPIGNGLQDSYALAKVVTDAFEGSQTPGGAWFRNIRLNEVGRDGQFYQMNVIIEFSYDEIK